MGFISRFIKCFCCVLADEYQPREQQEPELVPTGHDAKRNSVPTIDDVPRNNDPTVDDVSRNNGPRGDLPSEQKEPEPVPTGYDVSRNDVPTVDDVPRNDVPTVDDVPRNDAPLSQELVISSSNLDPCIEKLQVVSRFEDPITTSDQSHYQNDLEIKKIQDYHNDPSTSHTLQQEVLGFSDCFLSYKDALVNNNELVRTLNEDASLPEELHLQEPEEKNEDVWTTYTSRRQLKSMKSKEQIIEGVEEEEKRLNDYSSFQKILLVGEGDFSFSAALANVFISASNMTATSLNSKAFLKKNYGRAISNIADLKRRGCEVIHGVDATKMANHPSLKDVKFDRIIYNFPHAGFVNKESRESTISRHQQLVIEFLENAKGMISEGGEIHITHKTSYGFHRDWNIGNLGTSQGLNLLRAVDFNCEDYPGYRSKYGFGGDKDFDCNPSKTYKFGFRTSSSKRSKRKKKK